MRLSQKCHKLEYSSKEFIHFLHNGREQYYQKTNFQRIALNPEIIPGYCEKKFYSKKL